jgi:hypothetical protein
MRERGTVLSKGYFGSIDEFNSKDVANRIGSNELRMIVIVLATHRARREHAST